MNQAAPPSSGDNAQIFTGIRDIPIWAGESSSGNQLPGGPYRWPELAAIAAIMGPTLLWIRNNTQSAQLLTVLAVAVVATLVSVVALRFLLPKARPDLPTRTQFFTNAMLPRPVATSQRARPTPNRSQPMGRSRRTASSRRARGSR